MIDMKKILFEHIVSKQFEETKFVDNLGNPVLIKTKTKFNKRIIEKLIEAIYKILNIFEINNKIKN